MEDLEFNVIQRLLLQVNQLAEKYDNIALLSGEKFNIFSIMSMEQNEVYTHSAFISELLNPNGSHGQGSIFLKLFIDQLNKNIPDEKKISQLEDVVTYKEFTINKHFSRKPCGGRIDIYITNKKQSIIIEN